jgi:dTMP kinase
VARISRWATESLTPTLTVIMDLPAEIGLGRLHSTDRLESEPLAFHERVRQEYLNLAHLDPERFLVVDASLSIEQIHQIIIERVGAIKTLKRNLK